MSRSHDTGSSGRTSHGSRGSGPSSSSSRREGNSNRRDHHNDRAGTARTGSSIVAAATNTISPNGLVNGKAADTYAQISREQYDDWLRTFYPKQKELLEKTQNGTLLNEQLSRVNGNVASSMRAAEQAKTNQMARYGIEAEEDPNQAAKQALTQTTSMNSLREYEKERSMNVLAGTNSKTMEKMVI